jgi:hypothetical protein
VAELSAKPNRRQNVVREKRAPTEEALTYDLYKFKPLATEHHIRSVSSKPREAEYAEGRSNEICLGAVHV